MIDFWQYISNTLIVQCKRNLTTWYKIWIKETRSNKLAYYIKNKINSTHFKRKQIKQIGKKKIMKFKPTLRYMVIK